MTDLARRMEQLRDHVEPAWSAQRAARIRIGITRRQRGRRALMAAGILCGVLLLLALQRAAPGPQLMRFPDGSSAQILEAGSALRPLPAAPGQVRVELAHGAARFRVVPQARRLFRVEAGAVSVEVLGTRFGAPPSASPPPRARTCASAAWCSLRGSR